MYSDSLLISMIKYFVLFYFLAVSKIGFSQTLPITQTGTDDMLRVLQLLGKLESNNSFTARPFFYDCTTKRKLYLNLLDSTIDFELTDLFLGNNNQFAILPLEFSTKFNSHHPYGWNDQGMIKTKGLANTITAGVYSKLGPLSIQLQPEFNYAANPNYETTSTFGTNTGNSYSKASLGQSAIRLNLGAVSLSASTENLWWGPGQFSSLFMSNNAPGFAHLSFHTNKPLKTSIGSFEWQLVAGKLDEDSSGLNESNRLRPTTVDPPYSTRNYKAEWRYFNGLILTYQPVFMKGFFFGVIREDQIYNTNIQNRGSFLKKWLPVFSGGSATNNADSTLWNSNGDGYAGIFTRWILPKYQAEFYVEYGYNDFKQNFRDFTVNANHSSAYIVGFKKIFTLKNNQLLDFSGEITQMANTTSYIVRNSSGNWYTHTLISQGLTNQNKILGAGSGVGNNVQTLQAKKIKGFDFWGIKLQRIQQDPRGVVNNINTIGMREIQWNDYSLGLLGQKRFNRLLLKGEVQFVNSKNYGWEKGNKFNLYALINMLYFF